MRRFKKISFIIVGFCVSFLFIHFVPAGKTVFDSVAYFLAKVSGIGYHASRTRDATHSSTTERTLLHIRAENSILKNENEELRELLQFKTRTHETIIVTEVIGRSLDPQRAFLFINRDASDVMVSGAPVVVNDGVLVGVVTEVQNAMATVRLLTDPQSKVIGRLLNDTFTEGVVSGGHGIAVRMELVPRSEKIALNDVLVSSGLDISIPRGLIIGKVTRVSEDANTLFQRVIIESPVDYTKLLRVGVIVSLLPSP